MADDKTTQDPGREMVPAGQTRTAVVPAEVVEAMSLVKQGMEGGHNVLVTPAMLQRCPAMFTPAVTAVSVPSTDPRDNWVYKIPGGGELGLSKPMLLKLSAASGVTFIPEKSGRLDDCQNPHYCRYRVVGQMVTFDGTPIEMMGTKEIDLRDESPLVRNMHRAAQKTEDYYAKQDKRQSKKVDAWERVWATREHIESMAETKAMLRLIRALLGVKTSYGAAELKKPFLVMKMVFSPPDDPEINRMIAAKALGMTDLLYDGGRATGEQPARPALHGASDPAVRQGVDSVAFPDEAEAPPNEDADLVSAPDDDGPPGRVIDATPPREQDFPDAGDGRPAPPHAAGDTATAAPKASVLRCECACGCTEEVTEKQARWTAGKVGVRLCGKCYPDSPNYDYERHQGTEG